MVTAGAAAAVFSSLAKPPPGRIKGGGTALGVGEHVRVVREGELKDLTGVVTLARSGYYQVKFDQELDDKRSSVFFRGKELWRTADGEPPPPEVLKELPGRTAPAPRPASQFSLAERGFGYDGGGGAGGGVGGDGWLMDLGIERGQRKRKPTQLYDAETGGHAEPMGVPAGVIGYGGGGHWSSGHGGKKRDRDAADPIEAGSEVLIVKPGPYENICATVQSMHNGYYQVITEHGTHLNVRAKDCSVITSADGRSLADLPPSRAAHMSSSAPTYHPPLRDSTDILLGPAQGEAATMAARAAHHDPSCRARATRFAFAAGRPGGGGGRQRRGAGRQRRPRGLRTRRLGRRRRQPHHRHRSR